ncbi:MAG TPA: nitroreductase family protein [Gemmatimonadales bacterium]|nr:nitroreductase family protein [Gemmatimonadales bacterium]
MSNVATQLTVPEAAEARRSIRKYAAEPIPLDDVREILRLTGLAPTPFNVQPARYVVVTDPDLKGRLAQAAYQQPQVTSAPAVIVVYSDMVDALATLEEVVHPGYPVDQRAGVKAGIERGFSGKPAEENQAWGHAISYTNLGYLLLVARSLGYSTSAMLGFQPDEVKRVLGLPAHVTIPALVAIGKGDEEGFPHHRHPIERVAAFR